MKAVRLHGYGNADVLVYEEAEEPIPGAGEVRVRVAAAGMNPIDLKVRSGSMKEVMPTKFPAILGSDLAGVVESIGPDVSRFKVGDRVVGVAKSGSDAQLALADQNALVALPPGLDEVTAAALPVIGMTGAELVETALKVKAGERLLITGALGGVGRIAVQTAALDGIEVWAGVRGSQSKQAASLPAKGVLALDDAAAMQAAAGTFDAVADTIGGSVGEAALKLVRAGGRFATIVPPPPAVPEGSTVAVQPHFMSPDTAILSRLVGLLAEGKLSMPAIQKLPLEQTADGHRMLEGHKAEKIVLVVKAQRKA